MATTVNGQAITGPLGRVPVRVTTNESTPVEVMRWSLDPATVIRVRWKAACKRLDDDGGDIAIGGAALVRDSGAARVLADSYALVLAMAAPEVVQAGDDVNACVLRVPATTGVWLVDFEVIATSLAAGG